MVGMSYEFNASVYYVFMDHSPNSDKKFQANIGTLFVQIGTSTVSYLDH